jgi:branched-chain amino acid transport system ATP-binding protein
VAYTGLYDLLLPAIPLWRLALGGLIIVLVLVFPRGLAGVVRRHDGGRVAVSAPVPIAEPPVQDGGPPPRSAAPLLEVHHLRKDFGGVRAVADISFSVLPGEIVALIGSNGAGKSTCFNLLNGQVMPDGGRIVLAGQDIAGWPPRRVVRLGVGRSFQVAATFPSMTACENVQIALASHRSEVWRFVSRATFVRRADAMALLAQVGLADQADRACSSLAYGDAKRLEFAVALSNDPLLLLMDEPTAGMALAERWDLMRLVQSVARRRGCSVLFTEHDMDVVFRVADRVLVMDRGMLIADGEPAAVRADTRVRQAYLGTSEAG